MASRVFSAIARQGARSQGMAGRRFVSTAPAGDAQAFVAERNHIKEHAAKSADLWRKVSLYVCIPGAIVGAVYIYGIEAEHHAHAMHEYHEAGGQVPERTVYEYNLIRKKGFPWGDGTKSFFHNDIVNTPAAP